MLIEKEFYLWLPALRNAVVRSTINLSISRIAIVHEEGRL